MKEKKLPGRIIPKHGSEAAWSLAKTFTPKLSEVIIYDPDSKHNYSRIKIGDGVTLVNDLPFYTSKPEYSIGLSYELNESGDAYIVTGIGTCQDNHIVFPEEYLGKPVTEIAASAFEGCMCIYSIAISKTITTIGSFAFSYCWNLKNVIIPKTVINLDKNIFQDISPTIYCEVETKPDTWDNDWNVMDWNIDSPGRVNVIWGFANNFIDATNTYAQKDEVASKDYVDSNTAKPLAEIDRTTWDANNVPQDWRDTEISKENFPCKVTDVSLQKTKDNGYAYDFGRAYNRVYVEKSGDGWGGSGGGQYSKYALTLNPSPVPDPDYKDWEIVKDDEGNIVSMTPKSFNDSIPMRRSNGHIRVPRDVSSYENTGESEDSIKMYATSKNYVDTKDAAILAKIPSPAKNGHWAYTVNKNSNSETPMHILISHSINGSYSSQIPLRADGIIKTATPVNDLDCANKKYVDDLLKSLTERIAALEEQLANILENGVTADVNMHDDGNGNVTIETIPDGEEVQY